MTIQRNEDGTFPAYAWPGCYPIFYLCADGGSLCPDCANGKNGSEASEAPGTPKDWHLVASGVHWEGEPIICDHCAAIIESAYGNPEGE